MASPSDTRRTRGIVLFFAGTHTAASLAGLYRPGVYGFPLGGAGHGARVRVLAALDLAPTLAVTYAAVTRRPLRRRLQIGALSDLLRAALLATWFDDAPRSGRAALIAASLAGATLAACLGEYADPA